jgi:hypothetical protein
MGVKLGLSVLGSEGVREESAEEATGGWRALHSEPLHHLYYCTDQVLLGWTNQKGYVSRMSEARNA